MASLVGEKIAIFPGYFYFLNISGKNQGDVSRRPQWLFFGYDPRLLSV
jgi:hypothetical protein